MQSLNDHEIIIAGPYETGKTWATLWRIDSLLRAYPGAQALMTRTVRADMDSSCIQTYRKIIERRGGVTAYGGEKPQWFDYKNRSRMWIAGLDNPGKALSAEYDFIYVNQAEQFSLEQWQTLTTRCTGRAGNAPYPQIIGDCNPGGEGHWILKRQALALLRLLHSKHSDNPRLYNDDGTLTSEGMRTMRVLDGLTGILRDRGRDGKWVGAEGLFFTEWDDRLHTCDPFPVPADWPVWGALDYGFAHPTVFGLLTMDNDGCVYLIGEHVQHRWLPPAHCRAIRQLASCVKVPWHRITAIVAGHDCFMQRGDQNAKTIAEQYAEARDPESGALIGIDLEKATIDRKTGAQELLQRLGNAKAGIRPRLRIFNTCKQTIAAMKRMVCDPRDPEDVLKINADQNGEGGDDAYDMLRYGVMHKVGAAYRAPAVGGKRTAVVNFRRGLIG